MSEWGDLGANFGKFTSTDGARLHALVRDEGQDIMEDWRENARKTSGRAASWYVPSIQAKSRRVGTLHYEAEVSPIGPGGGVGFEFGSRNQPPHLDGMKAAQVAEERLPKRMLEWIEEALEGWA